MWSQHTTAPERTRSCACACGTHRRRRTCDTAHGASTRTPCHGPRGAPMAWPMAFFSDMGHEHCVRFGTLPVSVTCQNALVLASQQRLFTFVHTNPYTHCISHLQLTTYCTAVLYYRTTVLQSTGYWVPGRTGYHAVIIDIDCQLILSGNPPWSL